MAAVHKVIRNILAPIHLFCHSSQVLLAAVSHFGVLEGFSRLDDGVEVDAGARIQVPPHHDGQIEEQRLHEIAIYLHENHTHIHIHLHVHDTQTDMTSFAPHLYGYFNSVIP